MHESVGYRTCLW